MDQNQNRIAKAVGEINGAKPVAAPRKTKASGEFVLAAQLNQSRETIINLRKQVAEQEQIIAQLQNQVSFLEVQNLTRENEKLREDHGLKIGQQLIQENGEWFVVEAPAQGSNGTA